MINRRLAIQKNLSLEQISVIENLHVLRDKLFNVMQNETDIDKLKDMDKQCTDIEFKLQDAWNFDENSNYHKFWYRPHCTCPKIDNDDAYPTGYYVRNNNCPLHGGFYRRYE